MAESYADQLLHVREIAESWFECSLDDYDLDAIKAVLAHYDAYAAVVRAVIEVSQCDEAVDSPRRRAIVLGVLDELLQVVNAIDQADAEGIPRA